MKREPHNLRARTVSDDITNIQLFALGDLAKDPVIGTIISNFVRGIYKNDPFVNKVESEFPGTEIQECQTAALDFL